MATSVGVSLRDCARPAARLKLSGVRVKPRECRKSVLRLSAPGEEKVFPGDEDVLSAASVAIQLSSREDVASQRQRRRRSRKWKPYDQPQQGKKPLAPYNTTQFLMSDHGMEYKDEVEQELDFSRTREPSLSLMDECDDGDLLWSAPSDDEFTSSFNAEWLSKMSQAELVLECTELNRHVEIMEEQVNNMRSGKIPMSPSQAQKIMVIQQEIQAVLEENQRLSQAVEILHKVRQIPSGKSPPAPAATLINTASSDSGIETTFDNSCIWQ